MIYLYCSDSAWCLVHGNMNDYCMMRVSNAQLSDLHLLRAIPSPSPSTSSHIAQFGIVEGVIFQNCTGAVYEWLPKKGDKSSFSWFSRSKSPSPGYQMKTNNSFIPKFLVGSEFLSGKGVGKPLNVAICAIAHSVHVLDLDIEQDKGVRETEGVFAFLCLSCRPQYCKCNFL